MSEAFDAAWSVLKALPEQQMFVERTPRENAGDEGYEDYLTYPEIDRYGARSLGTVHPAIMAMIARNKSLGDTSPPNLNLDMGAKDDNRISADARAAKRGLSSGRLGHFSSPLYGRSIARGPEYNRREYDERHYDNTMGANPVEGYNLSDGDYTPTVDGRTHRY